MMKTKRHSIIISVSFIIFVAMLIGIGIFSFAGGVTGDLDGDGKVSAGDARLALRHSVGLENLSTSQQKVADLNGDGKVTAADARLILRLSVGLDGDAEDTTEESTTKKTEESTTKTTKKVDHYTVNGWYAGTSLDYIDGGEVYYIHYTDGTKEGPFTKPYPEGSEPSTYDTDKCLYCGKEGNYWDGHFACARGGCTRWLCDMTCPECGEFVKANTCHTCK